MNIIPFRHEGLGNNSYLVGIGNGRAIALDPDRNVNRYIASAEVNDWRITAVLETHVHADFVTGAVEIAAASGAEIISPAGSGVRYPHRSVQPGERIILGDVEVECVASPGHTPEHMAYVLRCGDEVALFSGGSLLAGAAARTDLIAADKTEELTRAQYRTLNQAFASLSNETLLFPTHGGGSFCSATGGASKASSLGTERAQNPLLAIESEDEFVRTFPALFPAAPPYFFEMRAFNQAGPRLRCQVPKPGALGPSEFSRAAEHSLIVDLRSADEFAAAHLPGALNIRFRPAYCIWLGWLVPMAAAPLLFVGAPADVSGAVEESMLVGHEEFAGWLAGGTESWLASGHKVVTGTVLEPSEIRDRTESMLLLDVREPGEFVAGHIPGALNIPLGSLSGALSALPSARPLLVYCGVGDRSGTAVSMLERAGIGSVSNLRGGIASWRKLGLPAVIHG